MQQIYRRAPMPKCGFNKVDLEQKQPSRGALEKRRSENMQQIYRRTSMSKSDYNKVAFQNTFLKNTSG